MEEIARLTRLFTKLGARDPEGWARSQVDEGIPQLARFLFLQQAWKLVVDEDDEEWIAAAQSAAAAARGEPGGALGPALDRLLAQGASKKDLTTVVRVMQWRLLFSLCYLMEDPGLPDDEVGDIAWRLFQVDEEDQPIAPIGGLHESVLETEPSGREMRAR